MNYTDLKTNVEDICENTFTAAQHAMFVQQAEKKLYTSAQLAALRKNVTGTLTVNNKYLQAPSDFLSAYSLAVIRANGAYAYLVNKDVNFIREAYPNPNTTGEPKYYAIFGPLYSDEAELGLILGPTPNAALTAELHYYFYPESIVTAETTWLGDNFDVALLNGTLMEAARFLRMEPDTIANFEKHYVQAVTLLKNLGDGKQRQDAYRSGQYREKVK